jgi:hypothetical protein
MNPNYLISIKRTAAQTAAAWLITQAARAGIDLPGDMVTDLIFTGIFLAYYTAYRYVESRWPHLLTFLGSTLQPMYVDATATIDIDEDDHADA